MNGQRLDLGDLGPCARCQTITTRYGDAGAPLCAGCTRTKEE